jgi:hypothetical protein
MAREPDWPSPRPNFQTRASFDELAIWVNLVRLGRWNWTRNTGCKYVNIRIDTRHGAHCIQDRDGNELSFADLCHQFGQDAAQVGRNPEGQDPQGLGAEHEHAVGRQADAPVTPCSPEQNQ